MKWVLWLWVILMARQGRLAALQVEHYHLVFFIRSEKKTLSMIFNFLVIYDS